MAHNLSRLFAFASTHKNISCYLAAQDPFNVPPIVRRTSNLIVLWPGHDMDSMSNVARKSGMLGKEMKRIFSTFVNEKDSLWIDMTDKSPYPLRKNGYIPLLKKKEEQ